MGPAKITRLHQRHETATVQKWSQRFCVYQSLGPALDEARILEAYSQSRAGSRRRKTSNAAHPPPFVCHPSSRRRCRSALRAIHVRSCGHFDHADLHPCERRKTQGGSPALSSERAERKKKGAGIMECWSVGMQGKSS